MNVDEFVSNIGDMTVLNLSWSDKGYKCLNNGYLAICQALWSTSKWQLFCKIIPPLKGPFRLENVAIVKDSRADSTTESAQTKA